MSQLDILHARGSSGVDSFQRSNFKIYCFFGDSNNELPIGIPGVQYYAARGIGAAWNFYNVSSGAYNQTNIRNSVDNSFDGTDPWAAGEYVNITLYFCDSETAYYSWSVADASTCITDTANLVSWSKSQWATHTSNPMYVGVYSPGGGACGVKIGSQAVSYLPWNITKASLDSAKADNDSCGVTVANSLDWLGPELYATSMDRFATRLDWHCKEKARKNISAKLIPFLQPTQGGTSISQQTMAALLEYSIRQPECDGLLLWNAFAPAPAGAPPANPAYYDGQDWMIATLAFVRKYGLTKGNPF